MPTFDQYSQKSVLIVDDMAEMRASLRAQVSNLGITRIHQASSIRDALELLGQHQYDLILSDYYLGQGTNGQQFLEYLRTRGLISRATVFIIVTAEQGYEKVITAAEMMPDDYLLKPFTAATLSSRLDKLMERKERLEKIDRLQDARRWNDVIAACDEIMAAKDKYFVDALRIKGSALLAMNRFDDAIDFYHKAISIRSTPWAKLGLAKAQHGSGEVDSAISTLRDLLKEFPTFMVAYDMLSNTLRERDLGEEALETLQEAAKVSPNSLGRQRAIASVAETMQKFDVVEQAMTTVIGQIKNTPLQESGDFARLGNALVEKGTPDKALAVLADARKTFRQGTDAALLAAMECVAHHKTGNAAAAEKAYQEAIAADLEKAPDSLALMVAKAALAHGDKERSEAILKRVVQNNPDSKFAKSQVAAVMEGAGLGEEARQLLESSEKEIFDLNNRAVRAGQEGRLGEAAQMLSEAADKLPGNVAIVANAAYALLADVMKNGFARDKHERARRYMQQVYAKNAQHPKLAQIADLLRQIQQTYPEARG